MSCIESDDDEVDVLDEVSKLIKNVEQFAEAKAKEHAAHVEQSAKKMVAEIEKRSAQSITDMGRTISDLTQRVGILEKDNETLKRKVNNLEDENQKLWRDNKCKCDGLVQCVVDAAKSYLGVSAPEVRGQYVLTIPGESTHLLSATVLDTGTTQTVDLTNTGAAGNEILTFTAPSGFTPLMNSSSVTEEDVTDNSSEISGFSRLLKTPSASSQVYSSLDDVPEELRSKIEPFVTAKSVHCNNDKMSDLQRAYISYKLALYKKMTSASKKGKLIFMEGVNDHIWTKEYDKYVPRRVKNTLNAKKIADMKGDQSKRMKAPDDE